MSKNIESYRISLTKQDLDIIHSLLSQAHKESDAYKKVNFFLLKIQTAMVVPNNSVRINARHYEPRNSDLAQSQSSLQSGTVVTPESQAEMIKKIEEELAETQRLADAKFGRRQSAFKKEITPDDL